MQIAFATTFDAQDLRRGSGTFYFMSQEIARQGHEVHYVGPVTFRYPFISRLLRRLHGWGGKRYVAFLDPYVGQLTGRNVAAKLSKLNYDLLLSNDPAICAFTPSHKPIVLYTDVMITHNYSEAGLPNARLSNMSFLSLWLARKTLRAALKRANLAVFPVQWVADEAVYYGVEPTKVRLIPFGANIVDPGRSLAEQRTLQPNRFDLLFVGKDWARKGGEVAVGATLALRQQGVEATLHCVGSNPTNRPNSPHVKFYGLLDKTVPAEREQLYQLYANCDGFILPSSSEGFVIAPLEAAAFGLPALAYDAHGVRDAIRPGETGYLYPLGSSETAFVAGVMEWLSRPELYRQMALAARAHYENSVNWQKSIATLLAEISQQPWGQPFDKLNKT